ncbi:pilus assembly protein [Azoarcus sp. L1K30]|uniref:pilus assembly PilX family protein n=1 Tax=Azoarcus sp. L1K30 TaxID=2820277 RepID=UPI001B841D5C|nr:PilX N-terminal domain-containing pilus assembly protein [Azoarcus sp. L1K30]MBR0564601.1 pilus assembly protein [Azoarcus sp. L1K30]
MRSLPRYCPAQQRGAALIIALILLMVMSLLGLSSIRATTSQEKMSANTYDRSLSFQAAENALRVGESKAKDWGDGKIGSAIDPAPPSNDVCNQTACSSAGLCQIPDPDCMTPRWNAANPPWQNTNAMGGLSGTPQYFVEALSVDAPCNPKDPTTGLQNCKRFRITARSAGSGRATVVLQSIYATD